MWALVADWDPDSPGPDVFCSGTLIAPTVFLTAAHCIASLEARGITEVWVTFAADYDEDAASPGGLIAGTPVAHPEFGAGRVSDTHDIAVVLLDEAPAGITPAQLPTARLLDQLKASPARRPDLHGGRVRDRARGQDRRPARVPGSRGRPRIRPPERAQPGEGLVAAVDEPLHRQRGDLLRRLGRPAFPRGCGEQPNRVHHHHRRCHVPGHRQDLPAGHRGRQGFLDDFVTLP